MSELDVQQARIEALYQLRDAFWLADCEGNVLDSNAVGRELLDALGAGRDRIEEPQLLELLAADPPSRAVITIATAGGADRTLDVRSSRAAAWPPAVRALVLADVTRAKEVERQKSVLANYDSLTGLPNRRLFEKQLTSAIQRAQADGTVVALLLLDLDQFKQINDSMGHAAGDELLAWVGEAIRSVLRGRDVVSRLAPSSDEEGVDRLGGDEFGTILGNIARSEDSTDIAERVLQALRKPVEVLGAPVIPSGSIGVAVYPQDASNPDDLTIAADRALYKAKELGRNQCQLYHPELGALEPGEFIDVAEKTGLIDRLGQWVLDRILGDIVKYAGEAFDRRIALHASVLELRNPRYAGQIAERLEARGVSALNLELEITERAFLAESDAVTRNLSDLRALGVRIQLDDFGTGRSSLSDLLKHRLDGVKIDRAFVAGHLTDRVASGVLRAILGMARELRIHAVAKGVETAEEVASLRGLGCEEAQGSHFGGAVGAEDYFAAVGGEVDTEG